MEILIRNGQIINANKSLHADVYCKDGKIQRIEQNLKPDSAPDRIIDAEGCYIMPGGIDPHVHMNLQTPAGSSSDSFYSGSKAALFGGTTTMIDFVTPTRGESIKIAIGKRMEESSDCLTDFSFHVSPVEWKSSTEQEIREVIFIERLKSFKIYMAYKDTIGLDDEAMFNVMRAVGGAGGMVMVHCEMGDDIEALRSSYYHQGKLSHEYHSLSRPSELEAKAVLVAIELAKRADCPLYIVHVSAKDSLNHIRNAQKAGQNVMAETCPHYLLLDDSRYNDTFERSAPYIISPPLRSRDDIDALWTAIGNGTIQTVGTDHCPFMLQQKEMGKDDFRKVPNGAGGVEHRLALLYTFGVLSGKINLNEFVSITSANAARIFGMFPAKGVIAVGSDADILIWNPNTERTISAETQHQNCDSNIFEGTKIRGEPVIVISNGEVAIEYGRLIRNRGKGKLLRSHPG